MANSRLRALVIAYNFPPIAAIGTMRTLRVVRELQARGWDVTVMTADERSYLADTPVDPALLRQVPPYVRVVRTSVWRGWSRAEHGLRRRVRGLFSRPKPTAPGQVSVGGGAASGGRRPQRIGPVVALARTKDAFDATLSIPDRHVGWLVPTISAGAWRQLRSAPPDVIYSSAPPWTVQLVAAALHKMLGRPWVADFRDPWARAPWREEKFRFEMRAAAVLERYVVRNADHVLFVAQANRDEFAAHYGPAIASKLHVIPNGCDPAEFDAIERPSIDPAGTFVLLHAGNLYGGRTPMPLIQAIAEGVRRGTIDPQRFRLRFLGNVGAFDVIGMARELGIDGVIEIVSRVPRRDSLTAMMSASALLLLQPGHAVSVPGKLYEYLAAGRPMLAIVDEGETAEVVRSSGIGVTVGADDSGKILDALLKIVELTRTTFTPPAKALFDGMARAADTAEILEAVARGQDVATRERADAPVQVAPAPHASRSGH